MTKTDEPGVSACLSELAIEHDYNHVRRFKDVMIRCMSFVMSKLGAKGVFHNTLLFSGRFLVGDRSAGQCAFD